MLIIDPPASLKAFLSARARGAPAQELKALMAADEAVRMSNKPDVGGVVIDFVRARLNREFESGPEA